MTGLLMSLLVSQNLFAKTYGRMNDVEVACSIVQTSDGGYAVAEGTGNFGAGQADYLFIKLGSDGNYTDCVADCLPTIGTPNPSTSSPSVGADCSPTVGTPSLAVTDVCEPFYDDVEGGFIPGFQPPIAYSSVPGGVLFVSYEDMEDMPIKIYYADGRVAYSGELKKVRIG